MNDMEDTSRAQALPAMGAVAAIESYNEWDQELLSGLALPGISSSLGADEDLGDVDFHDTDADVQSDEKGPGDIAPPTGSVHIAPATEEVGEESVIEDVGDESAEARRWCSSVRPPEFCRIHCWPQTWWISLACPGSSFANRFCKLATIPSGCPGNLVAAGCQQNKGWRSSSLPRSSMQMARYISTGLSSSLRRPASRRSSALCESGTTSRPTGHARTHSGGVPCGTL